MMPQGAIDAWKDFEYPVGKPYRPAIRSIGDDYYHLHLTFSDMLLNLADTSPEALTLKDKISRDVKDPRQRLARFAEQIKEHRHA